MTFNHSDDKDKKFRWRKESISKVSICFWQAKILLGKPSGQHDLPNEAKQDLIMSQILFCFTDTMGLTNGRTKHRVSDSTVNVRHARQSVVDLQPSKFVSPTVFVKIFKGVAPMEIQFSSHAVERVVGRFADVATYAEVLNGIIGKKLFKGENQVVVKKFADEIIINDEGERKQGDWVVAVVNVVEDGANVVSVVLRKSAEFRRHRNIRL
jgi:hypothetical protein